MKIKEESIVQRRKNPSTARKVHEVDLSLQSVLVKFYLR